MGSSCCDFPHPNPLYLSSLSPKSAQASEQQWKQLRRDCLSKEISRIGSVLFHFAQAASDGAGLAGVDTRGCDGRRERCRRRHEDAPAMAAVLEALLPYVKKMITDMAEEEVGLLLGVHGEMEKLGRNLGNVKAFLADAERRRIKEELVQGWVRMLKGVIYDATDVLELGQLKAEERRESKLGRSIEKMPGCFQPFLFCLRNPVFAHKIGSRIKELNQRLEDIHKEAAKFNFLTATLNSYPEHKTEAEHSSTQRMTSEFIPSSIVGEQIERDTRLLVHELTIPIDENHDIMKVVSIVGMGGMGKTTLAQKILKDATIEQNFKIKIWLSITQQFNEVELLRSAIKHAGGDPGMEQHDNTLLTQTLTNALSASKFLLVLDDMWSIRAWENVLSVPVTNASHNQLGSRVLITTRSEDLAPRMQQPFYQHHVNPLNEGDAWSLLKSRLPQLPNQVARVDGLRDMGMKIIKKCDGLPLAIKIIGGLLSTMPQTERGWEALLNHDAWSSHGLPEELDRRLYLSYEHLSPQLKQCFIYCSLIPKGEEIIQSDVIGMWISEGFIQPQGGSSSHDDDDRLEEVAEEYYRELIKRNLIEPTNQITRYKCIMHDVVRFFAKFIAREESLVVVKNKLGIATCGDKGPLRRLCIRQSITEAEWAILQRQRSLRTLIILSGTNLNLGDAFSNFSCLRVISIQGASSDSLVQFLCQLKHLRNLDLKDTDISRLPDDINKMKFLHYISLVDCKKLDHLPSTIVKLQQLRFLNIRGCNVTVVPKGFGRLTNLRRLYSFLVHMDMDGNGGWCSLEEIGPLSHLRRLEIKGLENVSAGSWAEKAMISSKGHLSYLVLQCSSSRYMGSRDEIEKQQQQKATEEVFEKLCPPTCVEQLWVEGYFGRHLPHWMIIRATSAFKSLRYLTMKDLPCCTQLPDGLGQLPSLEALAIEDAPAIKIIGPEFQASSSSVAVGGGVAPSTSVAFPSLTDLFLKGLCEWEEWEWEEQGEDVTADAMMAMPTLKELTIDNCKLSRLPPGLASSKRHALRELYLYELGNLACVENFPSVVELDVFDCPELKRITGLSRLQRIRIIRCRNLEVLEGVPALDSFVLKDSHMETLPEYLRGVNPRHLELTCSRELCESLSAGSSEWDKISHIRTHAIYCWNSDQHAYIQVQMKSDPSAGGARLRLEAGSSQSKVAPATPTS
ncbi:hypothetical protein EJB05_25615, partial [Eragrostis curvula]